MTLQTTAALVFLAYCVSVSIGLNSWDLPQTDLLSYVNDELDQDWMIFKNTYNKTYFDANEEVRRRLYWEDTLQFIQEHNLNFDRGESTFTVGENAFADMAEDEFEETYLRGLVLPEVEEEYPEALTEPDPEARKNLDWRKRGFVSSVKSQGKCGSCWAFSAIGALEGQHKKHHGGRITDLSEQNLVDCANSKWENFGCKGGWMNNAFKYIRDNHGVDGEICYPYTAKDEKCSYKWCCKVAKVRGWQNVGKSESSLQSALSKEGPVAIAMDVNHRSFWSYKSGIYYEPACDKKHPNHALVAVGYGESSRGQYWIIKNSWGTSWGEQGYLYAARSKGDLCGISQYASYPTGV